MGSIKEINPDVWGKQKTSVKILKVVLGSIIFAFAIWYFSTAIAIL